jgi:hypothetical protein
LKPPTSICSDTVPYPIGPCRIFPGEFYWSQERQKLRSRLDGVFSHRSRWVFTAQIDSWSLSNCHVHDIPWLWIRNSIQNIKELLCGSLFHPNKLDGGDGGPWLDSIFSRCGSARRDEKEAHFEQFLGSKPVTNREGVHFASIHIQKMDLIGKIPVSSFLSIAVYTIWYRAWRLTSIMWVLSMYSMSMARLALW